MTVQIAQSKAEVNWDRLPTVEGDATQLIQLFQNLVHNALKFYRKGHPPKIKITGVPVGRESILRSKYNFLGNGFKIQVIDNGIGLNPTFRRPFSNLSNGSMDAESIPEREWGWPFAEESWNGTAAGFRCKANREREALSRFYSLRNR